MQTVPKATVYGNVEGVTVGRISELRVPGRSRPNAENGKVAPPRRRPNTESRSREHLTPEEVGKLLIAARRTGRHGARDEALVLMTYRHGLRLRGFA